MGNEWPSIDLIGVKLARLMLTKPDEEWTDHSADRAGDAPPEEGHFNLITPNLGHIFGMSKAQMEARHPSGEFVFANRVDWAKGRLRDLGYITETGGTKRKFYRLTDDGRAWAQKMSPKKLQK
jgi:hypothetical protein